MPGIESFLEGFDIPKHGASSFFGRVLEGLERCVTTRAFLYWAVAEAECNTVIDLKLEHDAA